ncbi:hypothetical protein Peur_060618 [Populus x canadensis]
MPNQTIGGGIHAPRSLHGWVYSSNRKRSPFLSAINGKILRALPDFLAAEKANIINIGRVPSGTKQAPLAKTFTGQTRKLFKVQSLTSVFLEAEPR